MEELNPKARSLVEAARGALRSTDEDRARVEEALRTRLGADVLPPDAGLERLAVSSGWRVVTGLAVGAGVVAALTIMALQPGAQVATPAASTQQPPASAPSAKDEISAAAPDLTETSPEKGSSPGAKAAAQPPSQRSDSLAREVALLSRATAQLRAGQAAKALNALDEHERKFPRGALSEDRRAAKAQALCLLGRVTQGRAELAHLPPQSPGAARASQVCDAGSLVTTPP
jgi:hypothetical protein